MATTKFQQKVLRAHLSTHPIFDMTLEMINDQKYKKGYYYFTSYGFNKKCNQMYAFFEWNDYSDCDSDSDSDSSSSDSEIGLLESHGDFICFFEGKENVENACMDLIGLWGAGKGALIPKQIQNPKLYLKILKQDLYFLSHYWDFEKKMNSDFIF